MAKEKVVKLEVQSNVNDVTKNFNKLDQEIDKTTSSVDELNDSTKKLEKTNKKLEKSADGYGKKAGKSIRKTKKEVTELDKNLKKSNESFRAGSEVIGFVGDSMEFVGVESEALADSLGAVDSAMKLGAGVKGMAEASGVIKELGVASKISAGFQYLLSTAIGTTSGALKIFRLALISTGIGALVVGIGMLVANFDKLSEALTGGIEGFEKAGVGAKLLMLPLLPLIATIELVKKGLQSLGLMESEEEKEKEKRHNAEMDRIKQERLENERRIKAKQNQFDREIAMNEALGKSSFELRQQKIKDNIETAKETLRAHEEALDMMKSMGDAMYNASIDTVNEYKDVIAEAQKTILDGENQLKINVIKNNEDVENDRQDNIDKYKEYARNRLEAQRELIDRELNAEIIALETQKTLLEAQGEDLTEINQQIFDKQLEQEKVNWQREYDDVLKNEDLTRKEKNAIREAMEKEWIATEKQMRAERDAEELEEAREQAEKLAEIEKQRQNNLVKLELDFYDRLEQVNNEYYDSLKTDEALEIQAVRDKYYTIEQEAIQHGEDITNIVALREAKIKEIEDKYADLREAERKKELQDRINVESQKAQVGIDALRLISSIAEATAGDDVERQKRAFNIKKASDIASATMDGFKAVLSAYAQTPGGVVLKGIAGAIAGAFAGVQIANIAKQKFESPTGDVESSSQAGAGGDIITPEFNIVGGAELTDLEGVGQQPLQAYVVSGDVTTAQSLDRNRVENATI